MRWFLMALCAFELGALSCRRYPTVTALVHARQRNPFVIAAVLFFAGWLVVHLLWQRRDL